MALGTKVIDLLRLHQLNDPNQVSAVGQIAVMEHQPWISLMGILIEVINPGGVEAAGTALNAMNFVSLLKQEFYEIAAVLAGNTGDKSLFQTQKSIFKILSDRTAFLKKSAKKILIAKLILGIGVASNIFEKY